MATPYVKKNWQGTTDPLVSEPGATPITEEALDHLETQYDRGVEYTDEQISNHTQPASSITNFTEAVQDAVALLLGAGSNITLNYNDVDNTLTLATTALDAEAVRDALGIALVGVGNINVSVNDALDTIVISTTATANSTDAALRDRDTHTGVQSADTIVDGTTNKVYSTAEKAKLAAVAPNATANATDASLRDRSNHTGTQTADTITDGTTNKAYSAAEKTKLAGVATNATANSSDAALRDRTSHTGTQTSASISDFTEAVQDAVGALLGAGSNITLNYNDAGNTLTVSGTGAGGLDAEAVRDAIGVAMVGVGVIAVTVNDAADTITISSTATANSTDAALRDRGTHTGTQSADTVVDGTTNKAYTATEKTKLAGIATGATANATDAVNRARANHTGTQLASTISDFDTAADARVNALVPAASETGSGKVELATTVEAAAGTDTTRAVTPAGLVAYVPNATETARGKIELASDSETDALTDTVRAITPYQLARAFSTLFIEVPDEEMPTTPLPGKIYLGV